MKQLFNGPLMGSADGGGRDGGGGGGKKSSTGTKVKPKSTRRRKR